MAAGDDDDMQWLKTLIASGIVLFFVYLGFENFPKVTAVAAGGTAIYVFWAVAKPKWPRWKRQWQERQRLRNLRDVPSFPTVDEFKRQLTAAYREAEPRPMSHGVADHLIGVITRIYATECIVPKQVPKEHVDCYETLFNCFLVGLLQATKAAPAQYRFDPDVTGPKIWAERQAPLTTPMLEALILPFRLRRDALEWCFRWDNLNYLGDVSYPKFADVDDEPIDDFKTRVKQHRKLVEQWKKDTKKLTNQATDEQKFFDNTPYYSTFPELQTATNLEVYEPPHVQRFEGAWMVAPSGSGKTNALLNLIDRDLDAVYHDMASLVVMDSTGMAEGSLLHAIAHSNEFAPGQSLHDKLILLEPDPQFPLALNLFDIGQQRVADLSPEDREIALNTAQEMMEFILGGLLGAEMTQKQGGVFRYLIQALMVIPGATIFTLAELMENEGYEKHRDDILKLDPWTRDFFEKRFRQLPRVKNAFAGTKQELYWRIDSILSDLTFRRMFSHPENKLDLYTELQSSKVILINTNRALLKADRVETLGRYFIASIMQAIEQRGMIDKRQRKPVFIYLDEAHEYIAREPKIAVLLDTVARKNNVAFMFAHQRTDQIEDKRVLDALSNVAVRYAARNETDGNYLSQVLKTDPEILRNHEQGTFTTYVRDITKQGVTVHFPLLKNRSLMSDTDFQRVRNVMRERYTAAPIDRELPLPPDEVDDEQSTRPGTGAHLE